MSENLDIFKLKLEKSVPWFSVFSWNIHHNKCLFHMDKHIDQVRCITFVENVWRWNSSSKNIYKNKPIFCKAPCQRYQDIIHLLQNPKNFQGTPWALIITTCHIKLLRTGPLANHFVNKGCWIVCTFVDRVYVMTLLIFQKTIKKI